MLSTRETRVYLCVRRGAKNRDYTRVCRATCRRRRRHCSSRRREKKRRPAAVTSHTNDELRISIREGGREHLRHAPPVREESASRERRKGLASVFGNRCYVAAFFSLFQRCYISFKSEIIHDISCTCRIHYILYLKSIQNTIKVFQIVSPATSRAKKALIPQPVLPVPSQPNYQPI